jgi:ribonuclease E
MLINATQEEELRMAMVDGQRLYDLNIELPASERKKANIYKGQITRIEPSLEAAFVNYGAERHGFLPLKEISPEYFVSSVESGSKPNIRKVLKEGQDIVVQIDKEERGNKGAALTTYVSLAGRFIVLKPNKSRSGGVSRRIVGEERDLARVSLKEINVPKGMSVILRTAGIERSGEELSWDLENLLSVWEAIKKVVVERPSPFLIYRESNSVVRALRDYLTNEIGEILIDDEATYKEATEFVEQVMPHNLRKLKHYTDSVALFTRYQIESQIESAFSHSVNLPSGGSLVIDHTEALVSIDINSARATKGGDIEATALNTNLESADEIARQLRLRDLGGLVVIDFIDMGPQKNQRAVENRLREAVRQDRARVQLGKISRFGLLEMSRQRLRPSLGESSYLVCPRCSGLGNIRSVESLALAILRIIGEEARKERTAKVIAQLPVGVATYLLNEKRDWVQSLESRHDTQVILVANPGLETPHYDVRRVRDDQVDLPENSGISYTLAESEDEPEIAQAIQDKKEAEIAAITTVVATTPAPPRQQPVKTGPGLLERIANLFGGDEKAKQKKKSAKKRTRKQADSRRRGRKRSDGQRPQQKKTSQRTQQKGNRKRTKKVANKDADRKPKQQNEQQQNEQQQSAQQKKPEQQDDARPTRRRSRGGRRRRKPADNAEQTANTTEEVKSPQAEVSSATEDKPRKTPARKRKPASAKSSDSKPKESAEQETRPAPPEKPKREDATPARQSAPEATTKEQPDTRAEARKESTPSAKSNDAKPAPRDQKVPDEQQPARKSRPKPQKASGEAATPSGNGEGKTANDAAPPAKPAEAKKAVEAKKPVESAKPAGTLLPWEPNKSAGSSPPEEKQD